MPLCSYIVRAYPVRHRAAPRALAMQTAFTGVQPPPTPPSTSCKRAGLMVPPPPGDGTCPGDTDQIRYRRRQRCWYGDYFSQPNPCDTCADTFRPATQLGFFTREHRGCNAPRRLRPGIQLHHATAGVPSFTCDIFANEGGNCGNKLTALIMNRHTMRFNRTAPILDVSGNYVAPGKLRMYAIATDDSEVSTPVCCRRPNGTLFTAPSEADCLAAGGTVAYQGNCIV